MVFGNASLLRAKSPFWRQVLEDLSSNNAVVDALPIRCENHQEAPADPIREPGLLLEVAPQGGCLRTCGALLKCSHTW
jgi:hypothetical protein